MAQDTTEFVPILRKVSWSDTGAPDPSIRGIRPLGALSAIVEDGTVDAPGVGANSVIRSTTTLPANFMYSLQDVYCSIGGNGVPSASNWSNNANLLILDATPGQNNFNLHMALESPGASSFGISGNTWEHPYCLHCAVPKFIQKPGSVITLRFNNQTDDDIAATFNLILNFLVFTVAQEFDAGVNTPLLTR